MIGQDWAILSSFLNRTVPPLITQRIATFIAWIGWSNSVEPVEQPDGLFEALRNIAVQLAGNKVWYAVSTRNKLGEEVARKRLAEKDAQGGGERKRNREKESKRAGEMKSRRKGTSCWTESAILTYKEATNQRAGQATSGGPGQQPTLTSTTIIGDCGGTSDDDDDEDDEEDEDEEDGDDDDEVEDDDDGGFLFWRSPLPREQ